MTEGRKSGIFSLPDVPLLANADIVGMLPTFFRSKARPGEIYQKRAHEISDLAKGRFTS